MHKILPSKTGASFMAEVEEESDGSITILSNDGHGYRSAHRAYAAEHFGHRALWAMNRLTWINIGGARVILTRWNTQEFRTRPR